MRNNTFYVNRGSDLEFTFNWPDGAGGNADLTGYTVTSFEPDAALADQTTVTLTDPATGEITVRIEWLDEQKTGVNMPLRLQISSGEEQQSTNMMNVVYK